MIDRRLFIKFKDMKTKLWILLSVLFFVSCSQINERQMKKDAEKLIEVSQKADGLSTFVDIEVFFQSIQSKYQGEDALKFMAILREEVLSRNKQGIDCGIIELLYMSDKDFKMHEQIGK